MQPSQIERSSKHLLSIVCTKLAKHSAESRDRRELIPHMRVVGHEFTAWYALATTISRACAQKRRCSSWIRAGEQAAAEVQLAVDWDAAQEGAWGSTGEVRRDSLKAQPLKTREGEG